VAGSRKPWLINVTIYTLTGWISAASVGALLGLLGRWLLPGPPSGRGLLIVIAIAMTVIARELGWFAIRIPQLTRQTRQDWFYALPAPVAAALWGFDLGLIFTTWLTFSGVWLLVSVAMFVREPLFGVALFSMYWFGRALSVWVASFLLPEPNATPRLLSEIVRQRRLFQQVNQAGIVWLIIVLVVWYGSESAI
jgi:hypothetical protein